MITVIGNLVADPEPKTAGGHNLTRMRIASNERIKGQDGQWKDGDTTYIDVVCWRRLAEGAAGLSKGQKVVVYGKLKGRSYEKQDGSKGYAYEIEATDVGASVLSKGSDSSSSVKKEVAPDLDNPWGS
jgi:single-strand DNA-binding protein